MNTIDTNCLFLSYLKQPAVFEIVAYDGLELFKATMESDVRCEDGNDERVLSDVGTNPSPKPALTAHCNCHLFVVRKACTIQ